MHSVSHTRKYNGSNSREKHNAAHVKSGKRHWLHLVQLSVITVPVARTVVLNHSDNMCTVEEMASFTCSCPDAMMACDTGYDSGMYAALAFVLLAIAVWQCGCDSGTDGCSSDEDEAPEGMFT